MRVLYDHPGHPRWRLRRHTDGEKAGQVITGQYLGANHLRNRRAGVAYEEVPVYIAEGGLVLVSHSRNYQGNFQLRLEDREDGVIYEAGGGAAMEFLLAVQAGQLRGEGGALCGRFTFSKRGQEVHIVPWMPDVVAEARADAAALAAPLPDASAFIASLPPPKRRAY